VEGQCPARDQPGQRIVFLGVSGALTEKRVALGLIDNDLQAEHVYIIAGLRLQIEKTAPRTVMRVTVDNALHELRDCVRQIRFGGHPAHSPLRE
jgi:hypothetical protein